MKPLPWMHAFALSQGLPTPNPFSLVSLIRLIRNMAHHLPDVKTRAEIKRLNVSVPTGVADYFFSRFPRFNLQLYIFYFDLLMQTVKFHLQLSRRLLSPFHRQRAQSSENRQVVGTSERSESCKEAKRVQSARCCCGGGCCCARYYPAWLPCRHRYCLQSWTTGGTAR